MNITAVAIVAIVCWAIVELAGMRKKKHSQQADEKYQALEHSVEQLLERVAILEKIVTDDGYNLKKEIESLNKE